MISGSSVNALWPGAGFRLQTFVLSTQQGSVKPTHQSSFIAHRSKPLPRKTGLILSGQSSSARSGEIVNRNAKCYSSSNGDGFYVRYFFCTSSARVLSPCLIPPPEVDARCSQILAAAFPLGDHHGGRRPSPRLLNGTSYRGVGQVKLTCPSLVVNIDNDLPTGC